jgi:hypothetical protein
VEAVLVTHQNESVLVFLPVLSALLPAIRYHFVPVAFAVGLCSGLELLLLLERQGSPSLPDELAEFLKVVLLRRLGGRGLGETALSCLPKIEIVGRKWTLGRCASVEILGFDLRSRPPLSLLLVGVRVAAVGIVALTGDPGRVGGGAVICIVGRIQVCIRSCR